MNVYIPADYFLKKQSAESSINQSKVLFYLNEPMRLADTYLLNLLQEEVDTLQVHLGTLVPHVLVEDLVVGLRQLYAGEQIRRDAVEEG